MQAARNNASSAGNPNEQEEMVQMLNAQCNAARRAVETSRHTNDAAYSGWAHALLQLAVLQDDLQAKSRYLKECKEKFDRALEINPDSKTPDGQLSLFGLGNAYFVMYMFEQDDKEAEMLLEECKQAYKKVIKKEPAKIEIIKTIAKAPQQRKEVLDATKRMEGKTTEEQAEEYVKIVYEQVELLGKQVEEKPNDPKVLNQYGPALLELSMIQENKQEIDKARGSVRKARDVLEKSTTLEKDKNSFSALAVATNAVGMIEEDAEAAYNHFLAARKAFQEAIQLEQDVESVKQMLVSLKDMYKTHEQWKELHPLQAHKMKVDSAPQHLANLTPNGSPVEEPEKSIPSKQRKLKSGAKTKDGKGSKEKTAPEPPKAESAVLNQEEVEGADAATSGSSEKKKKRRNNKKKKSTQADKGAASSGDSTAVALRTAGAATAIAVVGLVAFWYFRRQRGA